MSGSIPREFIDDLLFRVDIVDLIESHLPLKKSGSNFFARCPFHTEKSPSFSVNRDKQFYHCFGCGVGGNAISFLMAFNHLEFVEAVTDLAGFAGLEVPVTKHQHQAKKHDFTALYSLLEQVAQFYSEQLKQASGVKAVAYLKKRGLSGEIAKEFSLGYAPKQWDFLSSRFDVKLLINAGMVVKKPDKQYDFFRGRLVFPIRDRRNRIVGFGGRVLDDSAPKYLNSPETAIFSKKKELYGLAELLKKHPMPARIVVVEGYMDVLALAQFDIHYSVAALGTATSKTHLDLLFRFTAELVFCFDADAAGQKAAWRAMETSFACLRDGRQVKIMVLPQGHDPDSLLHSEGVAVFEQRLQDAQVLSDYFIEAIGEKVDLATIEGRSQLLAQAKPQVEKMPSGFFREMMIARLRELTGISVDFAEPNQTSKAGYKNVIAQPKAKHRSLLSVVIARLLQNPQLIDTFEQFKVNWRQFDFPGQETLLEVSNTISQAKPKTAAIVAEYFRGSEHEKTINVLLNWDFVIRQDGVEAEFSDALNKLLKQLNEKSLECLLNKEKTEGLTTDEKAQLLDLLAKNAAGSQ